VIDRILSSEFISECFTISKISPHYLFTEGLISSSFFFFGCFVKVLCHLKSLPHPCPSPFKGEGINSLSFIMRGIKGEVVFMFFLQYLFLLLLNRKVYKQADLFLYLFGLFAAVVCLFLFCIRLNIVTTHLFVLV